MVERLRCVLARGRPGPAERPDISALRARALQFRAHLDAVKSKIRPRPFEWYPYDSFASFFPLEKLLQGEDRFLLEWIADDPVADIGCGDGALSFFLESLGCRVDAVDHPATNYNRMQGVRALGAALGSEVEILEADLDAAFPTRRRYGVALFFGILYHLKNPFGVLESLAERARYCLLSTRVARFSVGHRHRLDDLPVAYLLGEGEANRDTTNYWIFSESGLRRLLDRTGWELCSYVSTGDTSASDPVAADHDERAFCFLRSRRLARLASGAVELGSRMFDDQLGPSWYGPEGNIRWMPRQAVVRLRGPAAAAEKLYLSGYCPARQLREGSVEMKLRIDGVPLPPVWLHEPEAAFAFSFDLPAELVGRPQVELEISVGRTFTPPAEQRELGAALSVVEIR